MLLIAIEGRGALDVLKNAAYWSCVRVSKYISADIYIHAMPAERQYKPLRMLVVVTLRRKASAVQMLVASS